MPQQQNEPNTDRNRQSGDTDTRRADDARRDQTKAGQAGKTGDADANRSEDSNRSDRRS